MDSINQTAEVQNTHTENPVPNNQNNNTEFAEKGPLFTPKLKRKILLGFGIFGTVVLAVIAGSILFRQLNKPPELTPEPAVVPIENPEVVLSDVPRFAYIKNEKNIWISNIEGEEKFSILELPLTSESKVISLSWKDKENLGYVVCDSNTRVCEISTYNFKTKSIKPELVTSGSMITKFEWTKDQKYLAYMENRESKTNLRLKLGTIDTILKSFEAEADPSLSKSFVGFNQGDQYVAYSAPHTIVQYNQRGDEISRSSSQSLYVYQLNGAQIDEASNVSYPFFLDENTIAYKSNNRLVYKDVGTTEESAITDFMGYNPALSPNEKQISYWRDEIGFNNVVLGVFESDRGIHRNILRGVILPVWVSDDKIVGIKADSCIGERCLLYEYQTTSMVIVDVNNGEVISVDQGKTLSGVAFYAY
jgi:hypothetical protein